MSSPRVATYEKTFEVPSSRERIWEALTRPEQLKKWFAEHALVEPRTGGRFMFWGKHTAWTAREEDADQRITAFDPPSTLAFTWTWRGAPSEVRLTIVEREGLCDLNVRMTAETSEAGAQERAWLMLDFWKLGVGNLRAFLATGEAAVRPDFTDRSRDLRMSVVIQAPPEKVWAALTDPKEMEKWIATAGTARMEAGGEYGYGWRIETAGQLEHCGPTKVLEVVPHRLLITDWHHAGESPSRVRWELQPVPGGTRVTLTHNVPREEPGFGGYTGGWGAFMVALREYAQDGRASSPGM